MLVVRAQTLALHPEGIATIDAPVECRVQICCEGSPAVDSAEGSTEPRDGSPWALLSKERTLKFQYKHAQAGHFDFLGAGAGGLQLRVLARKKGVGEEPWLLGIASLESPEALRNKGSSWNDLAVSAPAIGDASSNKSAGRNRAIGALIVKASVPAARAAASEAAVAATSGAAAATSGAAAAASAASAAPLQHAPTGQLVMRAGSAAVSQSCSGGADSLAAGGAATRGGGGECRGRGGGGGGGEGGGGCSSEELERLRRETLAAEEEAAHAQSECERLEAQRDAARGHMSAMRGERRWPLSSHERQHACTAVLRA